MEEQELSRVEKMRITAQILEPEFEKQRGAWDILKFFEGSRRLELNFYLRYRQMSKEDKDFLFDFYKIDPCDDFDLFKRICKFWNVPITDISADAAG
jgi:hypothetical protein